jgi:hypothetical protein
MEFLEDSTLKNELRLFESLADEEKPVMARPGWLQELLKAAWQNGNMAGDLDQYYSGEMKHMNPFMSDEEQREYYGSIVYERGKATEERER